MKAFAIAACLLLPVTASAAADAAPHVAAKPPISQARAQAIALGRAKGGAVKSAELETELHRRVWSFDIAQPRTSGITEVLVDAATGRVLQVHYETPAAERAELRAERREKQHK